jgi:hypothetical protein
MQPEFIRDTSKAANLGAIFLVSSVSFAMIEQWNRPALIRVPWAGT